MSINRTGGGGGGRAGGKNKHLRGELINFDHKLEGIPLRSETNVKKNGGVFLLPSGAKVDIPHGAVTGGKRERLIGMVVSSSLRTFLAPWIGSNLRLASEVHAFYWPSAGQYKKPVKVFIPLSFGACRQLYTYNAESLASPPPPPPAPRAMSNEKGPDAPGDETASLDPTTTSPSVSPVPEPVVKLRNKKSQPRPKMIDGRSLAIFKCPMNLSGWTMVEDFTVVQPTTYCTNWPTDAQNKLARASRWVGSPLDSGQRAGSTDVSMSKGPVDQSPASSSPGVIAASGTSPATGKRQGKGDFEALELAYSMDELTGGVSFSVTSDLVHLYVIGINAPACNFSIDNDGCMLKSSLLHPFLSVRVPKRACNKENFARFKTIEIRENWTQPAQQFDNQMTEVEGCSDVYELAVPNLSLKRPATVRLPLPNWYVDRVSGVAAIKGKELWEQSSLPAISESPEAVNRRAPSEWSNAINKKLVILYQDPDVKRQLVWQPPIQQDEMKVDEGRRRSRVQVSRRTKPPANKCKLESIHSRIGWTNLAVGIKGGVWQVVQRPVCYTKRTLFFDTNILGRYVMISAKEPERTTPSKLAHLMTRVEALASAPPGCLVASLGIHPIPSSSHFHWRVKANIYPLGIVGDAIQGLVNTGFIPLIQHGASLNRKVNGMINALIQAAESRPEPKPSGHGAMKIKEHNRYRVHGNELTHVLLFNGICLELQVKGDAQIKLTSSSSSASSAVRNEDQILVNIIAHKQSGKHSNQSDTEAAAANEALPGADSSSEAADVLSGLGAKLIGGLDVEALGLSKSTNEQKKVRRAGPKLIDQIKQCARLQHHELLSRNVAQFDIQPSQVAEFKGVNSSDEKTQFVYELIRHAAHKLTRREKAARSNTADDAVSIDPTQSNALDVSEMPHHDAIDAGLVSTTVDETTTTTTTTMVASDSASSSSASSSASSSSDNAPYTGDDFDTADQREQLLETYKTLQRDKELSPEVVNRELLRRLTNILEKGKVHRASKMILKLYKLFTLGHIEVSMLPPERLPKLAPDQSTSNERKLSELGKVKGGKQPRLKSSSSDTRVAGKRSKTTTGGEPMDDQSAASDGGAVVESSLADNEANVPATVVDSGANNALSVSIGQSITEPLPTSNKPVTKFDIPWSYNRGVTAL